MAAMKISIFGILVSTLTQAATATQSGAAPAPPAPLRPLQFGHVNFLHTTDTHGWYAGHLQEPSFSADWGDYISFSEHLRNQLEAEGNDLLIVDTGDRVEGSGLYGASTPKGLYSLPVFGQQQVDLLCPGQHELSTNSSAEDDYERLVSRYGTHYLASNLCIYSPNKSDNVQFATRYRTFTTKKRGVRILAFGFISDRRYDHQNIQLCPVEFTVQEIWFREAILNNDVDLIVVIGNIGVRSHEFEEIHKAIRRDKPFIPIQFFGGQHHVRDYRVFDEKAHALASGRFMETVGFLSVSDVNGSSPKFARSYIDNNLHSFHYHTRTSTTTFPTEIGLNTTKAIALFREALRLDQILGCAIQPYWMTRAPYPHANSIYSLLTSSIFPEILHMIPELHNSSRLLLLNTGAISFDILPGPFTRDSAYSIATLTRNLSYIAGVPYKYAKELLPILNNGDKETTDTLGLVTFNQKWQFSLDDLPPPEQAERNRIRMHNPHLRNVQDPRSFLSLQSRGQVSDGTSFYEQEARDEDYLDRYVGSNTAQTSSVSEDVPRTLESEKTESSNLPGLTPGYVTHDDLGTTGDDTLHTAFEFFEVPNVIQALVPGPDSHIPTNDVFTIPIEKHSRVAAPKDDRDDELVDVVFDQFLTPYVLHILNVLPYILDPLEKAPDESIGIWAHEQFVEAMQWAVTNSVPGCVWMGTCPEMKPPAYARAMYEPGVTEEQRQKRDTLTAELVAKTRKYEMDDVKPCLAGESISSLLIGWVRKNWATDCEEEL